MSGDRYLRYDPSIERPQPDEAAIIETIVASIGRTSVASFNTYHHGIRQQHAKGAGYLRGELTVRDGLPDHLRQGLFATASRYPIIVRLSTALGAIKSDRICAPRGMAIKVLGVSGPKALVDDNSANQDFLLVNHPSYVSDAKAYLSLQRDVERSLNTPDVVLRGLGIGARVGVPLAEKIGIPVPLVLKGLSDHGDHPLGETFHTEGALRFGAHVARLRAVPASEAVHRLTGQPCNDGDDIVLESVARFFRENSADYDIQVQLCTDLQHTPIEDSSIDWPEDVSPPQTVGRITIPSQIADSPARRSYADDCLSFDPWRCLADHQPLGSIMRLRRDAYRMSRTLRHQQNKTPMIEPRDISELPN
ncbi:conserved hypothetical protein [Bradyrhizobium sp. STM 3843]|nr:conserved hypothetical protein [Bradyrhizobium sp. STM 3843]